MNVCMIPLSPFTLQTYLSQVCTCVCESNMCATLCAHKYTHTHTLILYAALSALRGDCHG